MSKVTPIPLGGGKFCYSGANCKRHGVNRKKTPFSSIQEVFSRLEEVFPSESKIETDITNFDYQKMLDSHLKNLSVDEKTALAMYSSNSGSVRINGSLNFDNVPENLKTFLSLLDSSISKFPNSPEERKLFRGSGHIPKGWENLKSGDEVEVKSFFSTSISPEVAMRFTNKSTRFLMCILTKEGAPVFSQADEYEFLLPREQKYEVVSFAKKTKLNTSREVYPSITSKHSFENVNFLTLRAL